MTIRRNKRFLNVTLIVGLAIALGGCSMINGSSDTTESTDSSAAASASATPAAEADVATPVPANSRLAKIEIGMSETKVRNLLGDPGDARTYPTGKNWIPFYFGGDTFRQEWMYKGVGRVVFSNTSRFTRTFLVSDRIHDPSQE